MAITSSTRALTNSSGQSPKKVASIVNDLLAIAKYNASKEDSAAAASGTLSVAVRASYISLDGTDARALPAPTFPGQVKDVVVVAGANTPVLALTVTGMRVGTADVYTSGTWTGTNAPLKLQFYSSDGVSWDPPIMVGAWTIS